MLTYLLPKLPERALLWYIRRYGLTADGIAEYLHDLFCPCQVDLDMEDDDASAESAA